MGSCRGGVQWSQRKRPRGRAREVCRTAVCGQSARTVGRGGADRTDNAKILRHRQPKGTETATASLPLSPIGPYSTTQQRANQLPRTGDCIRGGPRAAGDRESRGPRRRSRSEGASGSEAVPNSNAGDEPAAFRSDPDASPRVQPADPQSLLWVLVQAGEDSSDIPSERDPFAGISAEL